MMKKNIGLILIGVGIGLALAVAVAYTFGPYESTTKRNLFTGATWQKHQWLWHRWRTEQPASDYTKWARSHMEKERNWPVGAPSERRHWFEGMTYIDIAGLPNIPRIIYNMDVAKEEKVKLLHEYHQDLEEIRYKESQLHKLLQRWSDKLKKNT